MTRLHGGKFDENSYKVSGGCMVWRSVVNALSEKLELEIYRNGKSLWNRIFRWGYYKTITRKRKNQDRTGTKLTFWASNKVFSQTNYSFDILEKRLRELGF